MVHANCPQGLFRPTLTAWDAYPPFIVVYETPEIRARYPKVNPPLAQGTGVYNLDTGCLYDPEPIPTSTLLFPRRFGLILSRFEARFSIAAVHE